MSQTSDTALSFALENAEADPISLAAGQMASERISELAKEYKKKNVRIISVGRDLRKRSAAL